MELPAGLSTMLGKFSPLVDFLKYILSSLKSGSVKVLLQGLIINDKLICPIHHIILYFLLLG